MQGIDSAKLVLMMKMIIEQKLPVGSVIIVEGYRIMYVASRMRRGEHPLPR